MERSSSFGSASSAGSAFTSKSATTKLVSEAEKEQGIDNQKQNLLTALFGALYTLAKEKINDSANVAMLAIWVDFLMIFTLLLMPEYPWKVDSNIWIYKVFYYIQIHLPIAKTGYTFYLVIFYILVSTLFISVAICIWVGWCFMNDSFPFLWPIKVARVVVSLFVSMFYIASLNIFLMACACKKEDGHWQHLVFHLDCLGFPHIIHAAFSLTSGVVFFIVAFLLVLGDHELEPMSKSLLAAPHSMCELRALLCKTVITVADILLKPVPHVQVVLYCISCGLIFYYHARMVPHYVPWINVLRGGLNAVLAWVSLMACILSFTVEWEFDHGHPVWHHDEYRHTITMVTIVGIPTSFLLGGLICWGHLVYAWRAALKFKHLIPGVKPRTIHRFTTEFDVEIASRVGRVWDEEGALDSTALDLAENVLKAGVQMKPNSVFLHIVYSNFLIDARHNTQSGWTHLEQASKLEPNLSYQFSIFTRQQEHKQKSAGGGGDGEGSVDLVSYVEFQKNYRSLLVYHKASLVATREFWRLLTRDVIPMERLGHSFKRIEEMELMAEKTYKLVLDRYPTNAKLLKSYGKFLENVKNDPWGAARYYAEAEKQEELAENAVAEVQLRDGENFTGAIDEKSAIITINAQGIIQTINKPACQIFGYKKAELEGQNISCLMPAPFSVRHNSYLRNYLNTGKAKILDQAREVVAMHKDRVVFPLTINVSKISGSGLDAVFMGLLQAPTAPDPDTVKVWLLTNGTMLCVDQSFLDNVGWAPHELVGRAFSSLGVDGSELDDLIAQCAAFDEHELKDGAVQLTTSIKHKYAEDVPVHIRLEMGGTEDQRILVAVMRRLGETSAMAAFDHKGRCLYANTPLASMLGYKLSILRSKDINQLLPQPYGALHLKWLRDIDNMSAKQTPSSCRNGVTSIMLSSNGTPIHVKVSIIPHSASGAQSGWGNHAGAGSDTTWAVKVERSSAAALLGERRMLLLVASDGRIMWANPATPATLFGLEPAGLVGTNLTGVVDVFSEYSSGAAAGDMAAALAALLSCSASKPGISWRVGLGNTKAGQPIESGAPSTLLAKRVLRTQNSSKNRLKPAIMLAHVPSEDDLIPEDVLAAAGGDAAVVLELWRTDMLMGVAELAAGCNLTRVEPTVGLLFGVPHTEMYSTNLQQWLPAGTQIDDLMGTKGAKKGGLKASRVQKVGPRKMVQGTHTDGRPVVVQIQATVKDGSSDDRHVLALKVLQPLTGAPGLLSSIIAAEMEGLGPDGVGNAVNFSAAGDLGEAKASSIPGLAMDKVGPGTGADDLMGTNTHTATYRSNADSMMATARMVNLDVDETDEGSRTARGKGRAPAILVGSPTGQDGFSPRKQHPTPGAHFAADLAESGDGSESSDFARQAAGIQSPGAREMAVSSDSGDSGAASPRHGKHNSKKKRHLTEEEMEAAMEAKGARKAREWLDADFGGFKKADEAELSLPGAVEDPDAPPQLMHGRAYDDSEGGGDDAGGDKAKVAGDASGSEASASMMSSNGGLVSDYSRGKRLRKLTRLLSSRAALQVVIGFKFKVVVLAIAILLLHVGSFAAITGFVNKQASYVDEMAAAGEVLDVLHRTATLGLVLEAAQRDYGFTSADTAKYAAEMETAFDRYEKLHQSLYLGFNGLRSLDTPELYTLWHESNTMATVFLNATDPTQGSPSEVSLFNLGALYTAAARDVHYAALHPDSIQAQGGSLRSNRQWMFMQENAHGVMYSSYLKSLDYMVLKGQRNIKILQTAVLALLLIEGITIIVGAVGLVVRLLGSISVHRQALFSVFLAIPNSYLRTLASKSVQIGVEDGEDEEEEDDKEEQNRRRKKQQQRQQQQDGDDEPHEGGDSQYGGWRSNYASAEGSTTAAKAKRKANFAISTEGDADVMVHAVQRGSVAGMGSVGAGAAGSVFGATDRAKLFNGKQLITSAKSAYQLAWPFMLWGMLVVVLYGISYQQFGVVNDHLVAIKMIERSMAQASRVTYFATRVALEPDSTKRALMQPALLEESRLLESVYFASLYGGETLQDSLAHGSQDYSSGSLFSSASHKSILFQLHGCLRVDQSTCLPEGSPFYAVSNCGIDPMMQRLVKEAELMSLEPAADIAPDMDKYNSRFAFVWAVTWVDLHDGLSELTFLYIAEAKQAFTTQRTMHIVLLMIMFVAGTMFLFAMMRPFLKHISKESRRSAELLVQLPPDMDVEGMVAATWSVVKQERILAERSGKSFIDAIGGGGVLRRLSITSMIQSFSGQPARFQGGPSAGPFFSSNTGNRFAGANADGDRLFNPRQGSEPPYGSKPGRYGSELGSGPGSRPGNTGYGGRSNEMLGAGSTAGPRAGNGSSGAGGNAPRRRSVEIAMGSGGGDDFGQGGGDVLRRRAVPGMAGGGGKSTLSRRAIVPTDD